VGWVVGHSYIVYAPLLTGCTTVLYEGKPVGTPDAGAFWRVVAEHKVKTLFTAPTAFRALKKEDPDGDLARKYDLSGFTYLFLAGERLDPETYWWAGELLGVPVIDHWWQTETGWPIAADGGLRDGDGYLYVMGRVDDVINVAGHRLSTGQMEEVLASHPAVAECAVIGVHDSFKGQIPRGFVVLKAGVTAEPTAVSADLSRSSPAPRTGWSTRRLPPLRRELVHQLGFGEPYPSRNWTPNPPRG
jgi:propionyl-CoA synthetase